MGKYIIENEYLSVEVSSFGAELQSICDKSTGFQYLWYGDKAYWARRSPVLFPIVGKVWDGCMRYQGSEYQLSQHGFARDCEFENVDVLDLNRKFNRSFSAPNAVAFVLHSDENTRRLYPFDFSLYIAYQLNGCEVEVHWIVENHTDGDLYFQIGAHPAFNYRDFDADVAVQGYMKFDRCGDLSLTRLECGGYAAQERTLLNVPAEGIPITKATFAGDALVFERQLSKVSLCDKSGNPYVEVEFDAPVVGLWSPAKTGYAPFMCIEPWYGRCDDSHFSGDYNQKPYINHLAKGELFSSKYTMRFMQFSH